MSGNLWVSSAAALQTLPRPTLTGELRALAAVSRQHFAVLNAVVQNCGYSFAASACSRSAMNLSHAASSAIWPSKFAIIFSGR